MGWKDWPYWLRGGVLGIFVYLILLFISFLLISLDSIIAFLFVVLLVLLGFWASWFIGTGNCDLFHGYCSTINQFLYITIGLVDAFIIGLIIGFIVGKIKKKPQTK